MKYYHSTYYLINILINYYHYYVLIFLISDSHTSLGIISICKVAHLLLKDHFT